MRKIVQLEMETTWTNKELKVKGTWQVPGIKIIQVKVNAIRKEVE